MFLWEKFVNLILNFDLDFYQESFRRTREASWLYFAKIQEIPQQARQQLRPKPKSSGLDVEAKPDFHDKNF